MKPIIDALPEAANEPYSPDDKQRDFIMATYDDFISDYQIKNDTWDVLNNRTLEEFWADGNYDYNVIVDDDPYSQITQYSSGITRDKSNTFISQLTLEFLYPTVTAQNDRQQIDTVVSRISRSLLEYQFHNDGRPADSGYSKNFRYIHKMVCEGTVHIQDDVDEDGNLTSSVVPNEEIFIPNFFQPNIQLQSHVMRVQENASYAEAKEEFGDLDNFKYVQAGNWGWINDTQEFKERWKGVVTQNQCTIVRIWRPVPMKMLDKYKEDGKLPQYANRAKYFNIIINGVLMFDDTENVMPYHDGFYPVNKGVFENFSPAEFYWGNSMPNKCRQDKRYLDSWKTMVRYKAKLATVPPLLNFTGHHLDDDIISPGRMTDVPADAKPDQISVIPGISNGISNGDIVMMKDATDSIDKASSAPQTSGQQVSGQQTARESIIIEQNAQKALMGIAQQISFLQSARAFPILRRTFQFMTRKKINSIAVPNQIFSDGKSGVLEIVFEDPSVMTIDEKSAEDASFELLKENEERTRESGQAVKKIRVNKEYILNIDLYVNAISEPLSPSTGALKEARAEARFTTYAQRPDLFNVKSAARDLVRAYGDDESEMIVEQEIAPGIEIPQMGQRQPAPQQQVSQGAQTLKDVFNRQTNNLETSI